MSTSSWTWNPCRRTVRCWSCCCAGPRQRAGSLAPPGSHSCGWGQPSPLRHERRSRCESWTLTTILPPSTSPLTAFTFERTSPPGTLVVKLNASKPGWGLQWQAHVLLEQPVGHAGETALQHRVSTGKCGSAEAAVDYEEASSLPDLCAGNWPGSGAHGGSLQGAGGYRGREW